MENKIVCQISFLPLADKDGIAKVKKVMEIIKNSGLEHTVSKLSTTITAEKHKIFQLAEEIHDKMKEECLFIMDMRLTSFYE